MHIGTIVLQIPNDTFANTYEVVSEVQKSWLILWLAPLTNITNCFWWIIRQKFSKIVLSCEV
jgi:hypothetical protein